MHHSELTARSRNPEALIALTRRLEVRRSELERENAELRQSQQTLLR